MSLHKYSPALLTLLVFLLSQGLVTLLLIGISMLISPEISVAVKDYVNGEGQNPMMFEKFISALSLILMAVDIIAVLLCYFLLRNIRLLTADDVASIRWRPGIIAIAAGILGALSVSIVTEKVPLPDVIAIGVDFGAWKRDPTVRRSSGSPEAGLALAASCVRRCHFAPRSFFAATQSGCCFRSRPLASDGEVS